MNPTLVDKMEELPAWSSSAANRRRMPKKYKPIWKTPKPKWKDHHLYMEDDNAE